MQLVPENGAIKFFDSIDMDKVYKKDGKIEGFFDVPVTITGKWTRQDTHSHTHSMNSLKFTVHFFCNHR